MSNVSASSSSSSVRTRAEVRALVASMKESALAALALGAASKAAQREGFVSACHAIAIERMAFGSQSVYSAILTKARALPEWKPNKSGVVGGRLGKLIHAYGEALAVGKALADGVDQAADLIDLSGLEASPTFAALVAPPPPAPAVTAPAPGNEGKPADAPGNEGKPADEAEAEAAAAAAAREEPATAERAARAFRDLPPDVALNLLKGLASDLGFTLAKKRETKPRTKAA